MVEWICVYCFELIFSFFNKFSLNFSVVVFFKKISNTIFVVWQEHFGSSKNQCENDKDCCIEWSLDEWSVWRLCWIELTEINILFIWRKFIRHFSRLISLVFIIMFTQSIWTIWKRSNEKFDFKYTKKKNFVSCWWWQIHAGE